MALGIFAPGDPDEVSILVESPPSLGGLAAGTVSLSQIFGGGSEFRYWSDFDCRLALDTYSTVSFSAPFEAERREFRETFRPFSFKKVDVKVGGDDFFSGRMITIAPELSADSRLVKVEAYALPAVLGDCTEPGSAVPLEFKNVTLRDIVDQLTRPFGLDYEFLEEAGPPFEKVRLEVDQSPQDLLIELAKQRNLVIGNTADGKLLIWRSVAPGNPVARLRQGESPVGEVSPQYSPQSYFSEITGFTKTKNGRAGSKYTAQNPFLDSVLRPHSYQIDDANAGEGPEAVRAKLGRMFAGMMSVTVSGIPGWRDPQDNLFRPNTTVTLTAPDAMIYRETEFLVRAVSLKRNADEKSCALELVLPGAFSGELPESLPFEEP